MIEVWSQDKIYLESCEDFEYGLILHLRHVHVEKLPIHFGQNQRKFSNFRLNADFRLTGHRYQDSNGHQKHHQRISFPGIYRVARI